MHGFPGPLQVVGIDIRGVWPEIRPVVLPHLRLGQFHHVFDKLVLVDTPGKVGVGLAETLFGQLLHDARAGKGLSEEQHVRMFLFHLGNKPVPEIKGFGVGIVNPKDANAKPDPLQGDLQEFLPKGLVIVGFKPEVDDVLVFFRGVFGVLHRPVRPAPEPLWMLFYVRVVRCRLKSEVHSYFQPQLIGILDQFPEFLLRAQLWMQVPVAPMPGPYGPGHP